MHFAYSRFKVYSAGAFCLEANINSRMALILFQVIAIFIILGVVFILIGLLAFYASVHVEELVERYDVDCVPFTDKNKITKYIRDSSSNKTCTKTLRVQKKMKNPIYVYYQLHHFYQNHRRYVRSRSDKQLRSTKHEYETKECLPIATVNNNSKPIVPCGLIAWSLFNDTYQFSVNSKVVEVDRKDIAWKSDRDYKFGSKVYPKNFQSSGMIGGGKLNESIPLSKQEDLIVWMRTAAFSTFRKLYGQIKVDLDANSNITVVIQNNFNIYEFGGKKQLVLSTSNWSVGTNKFLGCAYLYVGGFSLVVAISFTITYVLKPRPLGDPAYLSWNKYPSIYEN
ncbi:putative ALA-interacting subunit 4 isoform X3 [Daucus carota subsp. sativus]|uniref:putative ALA-interacting subunit 4 isoform X3 n=2 Tax=Daucus carota subsp. sativus TaxID=79200 RepID=UPI0030827865